MALESERKYVNADLAATRKRLIALGAISGGIHFEENALFDAPAHNLIKSGKVLRLRLREWPGKRDCRLALKTPVEVDSAEVKLRDELETEIEDYETALGILTGLGYQIVARYEKTRESWRLMLEGAHAVVELDHLPFCDCVEIEGESAVIDKAAALLGLDKSQISLKSYYGLHLEWRKANNLPHLDDILFEAEEKGRLKSSLSLS